MGENMKSLVRSSLKSAPAAIAVALLTGFAWLTPGGAFAASDQLTFDTPQAAMTALLDALEKRQPLQVIECSGFKRIKRPV